MRMRALVKVRPGPGLELREVEVPRPAPGHALVRVAAAAVCGSDLARYRWDRHYAAGGAKDMTRDLPRVLGHEFAGTAEEGYADEAITISAGQPVAVRNVVGCGRCRSCEDGYASTCVRRRTIGVHVDGGYADFALVPAASCTLLPEDMDLHLAAALQPFAVATHVVRRAGIGPGSRVAVWGLGQIGLGVVLAARLAGAVVVAAFDINRTRLEDAAAQGIPAFDAREGVDQVLAHRSVDAMVDAAGAAEQVISSSRSLVTRGAIVLVGNLPARQDVDLMPLVMDEQRVLGCRSYSAAAWDQAVRTVAVSGFERTLGDVVALDDAVDRFETAARGDGRPFAVVP